MPKVPELQAKETIKEIERDLQKACRTYLRETADEQEHIVDITRIRTLSEELLKWLLV